MLMKTALSALLSVWFLVPATGQALYGLPTDLVDLPSAHSYPRAAFSLGVRIVPTGGLITSTRIGLTDYVAAGVSYGARNVIGTGEPDWDDRVEFELKIRFSEENDVFPALAAGYTSRGYGDKLPGGGYERPSPGIYVVAAKTLPFSEYWQLHLGVARTLEHEKASPDPFAGLHARFSQEFSVVLEYQLGLGTDDDVPGDDNDYLNVGLRWIFEERLQFDFMFRNLLSSEDSPERNSRSLAIMYYDSF